MVNLLKSNFYRMFKSKAFYICTIVYTAINCLILIMLKLAENVSQPAADTSLEAEAAASGLMRYKDGVSYGIELISEGDALFFIAIFSAVFITAEFAYGTMKNIVSKGFERYKVYISILIPVIAASFIMSAINFLVSTALASIFIGSVGSFDGDLLLKTLRFVGIEMLLYAAFVSLFVMIALIVRHNGGVIAIDIIIVMFGRLIYQLLELIVCNVFKINFDFSFIDYSLQNNIFAAINTIKGEHILRPILVGLIFLAVTLALGLIHFERTDVK